MRRQKAPGTQEISPCEDRLSMTVVERLQRTNVIAGTPNVVPTCAGPFRESGGRRVSCFGETTSYPQGRSAAVVVDRYRIHFRIHSAPKR
jgi:hypothetical protein